MHVHFISVLLQIVIRQDGKTNDACPVYSINIRSGDDRQLGLHIYHIFYLTLFQNGLLYRINECSVTSAYKEPAYKELWL